MDFIEFEYEIILSLYLFNKTKLYDDNFLNNITLKLYKKTGIKRSNESIRYAVACYKSADPYVSGKSGVLDNNYNKYFNMYLDDFHRKILKNKYKQFVTEPLENLRHINVDYIKPKQNKIITEITEYVRDPEVKQRALIAANYVCEIDISHETFLKKNGILYYEGHHLVPLHASEMFDVSLDVEANIISLCPLCHRELHYGVNIAEKIQKLYNERILRLEKCGIFITLEELLNLYNKMGE